MENETAPQKKTAHHTHRDELEAVRDFIEKHGMTVLVVLCVLIAAVTSLNVYKGRKQRRALAAVSELGDARTIPALESVVGTYGSTAAGKLAILRLAKEHYNSGSYDLALAKYDEFARDNPDHEFADVATVGRLHCLEASGQVEQALDGLTSFLTTSPNHYLAPQATFAKSRCLVQLDRLDEARVVLEDFMAAVENDDLQSMAEEQLESVNRKIKHKKAGITALAVPPALDLPPVAPSPTGLTPLTPAPEPAPAVKTPPVAVPTNAPPVVAPAPLLKPAPNPVPPEKAAPVVAPAPAPATPKETPVVDKPATNKPEN